MLICWCNWLSSSHLLLSRYFLLVSAWARWWHVSDPRASKGAAFNGYFREHIFLLRSRETLYHGRAQKLHMSEERKLLWRFLRQSSSHPRTCPNDATGAVMADRDRDITSLAARARAGRCSWALDSRNYGETTSAVSQLGLLISAHILMCKRGSISRCQHLLVGCTHLFR